MSLITLKNNRLSISIDTLGAELQSIQTTDGTEYLWQGSPEYWGRKSPVLFPFVGKLNEDMYSYNSKKYSMAQHGFARDNDFAITHQSIHSVTFTLTSSNRSLDTFPFKFELNITYTLTQNSIAVDFSVNNIDSKNIYFSIGAHPGFNLPLIDTESKEDYYIELLPKKERTFIQVTKEVLLDIDHAKKVTIDKLPITPSLFEHGVLIFETLGENSVSLRSKKSNKSLSISFAHMPFLGIWSPYPKEAPFVCLEPWAGIADKLNFNEDISQKLGIHSLKKNKKFNCSYTITFE